MRDEHLTDLLEAIVDGSHVPAADEQAHLEECPSCRGALDEAREIDRLLQTRELPVPPASFTNSVMLRIGQDRWRAERAIDAGFNLAMAGGVLVILAGAAGLAWSLGLLTITVDVGALLQMLDSGGSFSGRVLSQVQTFAMAAVLLTMALVLWWWAEAATD